MRGSGGGNSSNTTPPFLVQALVLERPLLVAPCTFTLWGLRGTLGMGRASTFKVDKHQWTGSATVSCQFSPSSCPSNSAQLGRGLHLEPQCPRAPLPEPARLKCYLDPRYPLSHEQLSQVVEWVQYHPQGLHPSDSGQNWQTSYSQDTLKP